MTNQELVALTALLPELRALMGGAPLPPHITYRKVWNMAVDGRLPTELVNGRHQTRRADLPAIATLLGLSVPGKSPAPKARTRKSALVPVAA